MLRDSEDGSKPENKGHAKGAARIESSSEQAADGSATQSHVDALLVRARGCGRGTDVGADGDEHADIAGHARHQCTRRERRSRQRGHRRTQRLRSHS